MGNPIYFDRISKLDEKAENSNIIRVVSYNMLADSNVRPDSFPQSSRESLDIKNRIHLLNEEIEAYGVTADLMLFQEVDEKYYKDNFEVLLVDIKSKFSGTFCKKTGGSKEGLATFYNKKFVEVNSHRYVLLDEMKKMQLWGSISNSLKEKLATRNQVLQLIVLELKDDPQKTIVVGNTHLYFHSGYNEIRILQTMVCLECIQACVQKIIAKNPEKKVEVFYGGDFNSDPTSSAIKLVTTGKVEKNDAEWPKNSGMGYRHKLNFSNSHHNEPTSFSEKTDRCIDYIFYQREKMKLLKSYPPPSRAELATLLKSDKVALPCKDQPSDHLPLIADFKWI